MRSVHWYQCGNANLRGKKTLALMAGKYVEAVIENRKERMVRKMHEREMRAACKGIDT